MDEKPHRSHLSASATKPSLSPAHHPPTPGRKHDDIAGAAFVVPHHASSAAVHGTHYRTGSTASHPVFLPSNNTIPSALATISSSSATARLPKPTTPFPGTQQLDQHTSGTATPIGQTNNNNNNNNNNNGASVLGPVLGAVAGLIVVGSALLWFFLRRRKRNQRLRRLDSSADNEFNYPASAMERGANKAVLLTGRGGNNNNNGSSFPVSHSSVDCSRTSLHQCAMSRDAKRLTADTLVSADRRSSLSTMVSKKQYTPQLAYSPYGIDKNDLLCVSPSNTLIDGFSIATEDDEKKQQQQQQQRVPSYQPQIIMDADSEMQNYYEYLTTNSHPTIDQKPQREEDHHQ
ncbi:hypothetical protein BX666DRAFT_1941142 [Dichotomocladium elegans]|nr:hypothetical protein BX666DRAFT_1941142 [Dichotomocladium elegans]